MKKTVYVIIIALITFVCMAVGVIRNFMPTHNQWGWGAGTSKTIGEEATLDAFQKLDVNASVCDLTVEVGEDYGISYKCSENLTPKYVVEGDTLMITQKNNKKNLNAFKSMKCKIVLTIPKKDALTSAKIDIAVGDLKMDALTLDDLQVEQNVGDMKMCDMVAKSVQADSNTGDVHLERVAFDALEVSSNIGDVKVSSATSLEEYGLDLQADIGDVRLDGQNQSKSYQRDTKGERSIQIHTDCGDIDVSAVEMNE
ncbi:MAG: DUF4097 family beta strand repeat-containing protein [Eubacteriales bacterium]|nr:DUF4097 family beta strand repeat-containing protein [Eubacteriales bacterium]